MVDTCNLSTKEVKAGGSKGNQPKAMNGLRTLFQTSLESYRVKLHFRNKHMDIHTRSCLMLFSCIFKIYFLILFMCICVCTHTCLQILVEVRKENQSPAAGGVWLSVMGAGNQSTVFSESSGAVDTEPSSSPYSRHF